MSLVSLLKNKNNSTLFTTPSHSGTLCLMHKFYQWYRNDISEVEVYNPQDALLAAEVNASKIYNTISTHFLTNGSSSGIIAAVLACCDKKQKLLIWDKSHVSHKNAGILAGADIIEYSQDYDEDWGIYKPIKPFQAEKIITAHKPAAIIITSPTYEGFTADVEKISQICKKNAVRLIVDEAHGALYPFSDSLPQSAIPFADFTVQSLHKTAGGINPTALLHCNCDISPVYALKMISTTSPSYPMLATIEANIKYLNSKKGRESIENLINNIKSIKSKITNIQFSDNDITKILIKKDGLSGFELSEILYNRFKIEDERTNNKSTMLLCGLGTNKAKLQRLLKLKSL